MRRSSFRSLLRAIGIALIVSVTAAVVPSAQAWSLIGAPEEVPTPDNDPFYRVPRGLSTVAPGHVLRSRPVDITAAGIPLPFQSWQLLYRTTDSKGHPTATVATLILPLSEPPAGGRNLLAYQPAEDSLTRDCASSYELRKGDNAEALAIALGLAQGWAVVVADHEGPESHWAAGVLEGHAVLDGIRAAERFPQSGLNKRTKVGMWGYSGGGLATAWASELHRSYAKKLNIVGAAYGGAPADVEVTLRNLDGGPLSGIALAGAVGVGRAYPEMKLNALWNKAGRAMAKDIGDMCIEDFAAAYPMRTFREFSRVEDPMALGRVRKVMRTISLGHAKPKPPLFIYHAQQDELNPISATDALVEKYCAMGARVSYHRDPASEHISLVATGAPLAATFLADRFDAKPAPTTCS